VPLCLIGTVCESLGTDFDQNCILGSTYVKGFWKLMVVPAVYLAMAALFWLPGNAAEIDKANKTEKTENNISRPSATTSVFMLPGLFDLPEKTFITMQRGGYKQARKALETMIRWYPFVPLPEYDPKGYEARRKYNRQILEKLSQVFERSFRLVKKIPQKDYLLARKRYKEFAPLISQAIAALSQNSGGTRGKPTAGRVVDFKAVVEEKNTGWDPRLNILKTLFQFDPVKSELAMPIRGKSPAALQLNVWYAQGVAAGNYGDLYDNRDGGHSKLNTTAFPQLSSIIYSEDARSAGMSFGLNTRNFYNTITIGNSSTARTGSLWRSLPRIAMTTPGSVKLLYLQYMSNLLYFYPEHRDHDPKNGDTMPANIPYLITSQGSSGSDQLFLQATTFILAALKPKVKQALKKTGLVMPIVQMIFRRGQKGIESDQDYLSGKAHPSVFQQKNIDVIKMIKLANELDIEDVPPMVGIKMVEESGIDKKMDSLPTNLNGRLFDTPGAISRIIRSTAYEKRMVVQADIKAIRKPESLTYRWVVLRGDASRIKIISKNSTNSLVEIIVPWHERSTVPGRPELTTDRVDIGVFADNGKHLSAPAFVSLMYPGRQMRKYNQKKQILVADYTDPEFNKRYTDPLLFPFRDWRDSYRYDTQGRLIGWQRLANGKTVDYTRDGAIVVERDRLGRAIKAQKVGYLAKPTKTGRAQIVVQRLPVFITYKYSGVEDRIGELATK